MLRLLGPPEAVPNPESPLGEAWSARTDEELMALVRADSRAAFRGLVLRHSEKVASFCARTTGDRDAGREIAQEVWITLWQTRGRWEPRARFASFLYTIAFSRANNHRRSRRRHENHFAPLPIARDLGASAEPSEIDRLLERERRERIWTALGELPDDLRDAVVLRFVEELAYEEMEPILRTKAVTLRSRVHQALGRLKVRLRKEVP